MENSLVTLQRIFEALGQEIRLRLFLILCTNSFCVCELEELFQISQPAISRHLNILKEAGLVTDTRKGQWVFYKANPQGLKTILAGFAQGWQEPMKNFEEMQEFAEKLKLLAQDPKIPCNLERER